MFRLDEKVALVTGGGWLGAPMVSSLCQAGAHVIFIGRQREPLAQLKEQLNRDGLSSEYLQADITSERDMSALIQLIKRKFGRLDIIVNNAHMGISSGTGLDAPPEAFADAVMGSVSPIWRIITGSLDLLKTAVAINGDASIINIASMYGSVSPDPTVYTSSSEPFNPPYYGSAKSGVIQLTKWLATHLGDKGIRVNAISPGPFPQGDKTQTAPEFTRRLSKKTALGRTGSRQEIGGAVVFLAGPQASFITGIDLPVDGGWTAFR